MIVINVYGIPKSKKYKILAYLYYVFTKKDISCELVTDQDVIGKNLNPIEITGRVYAELDKSRDKEIILTDLPLMLQPLYYCEKDYPDPDMYEIISSKLYKKFNNIDILISDPSESYLYKDLRSLLDKYNIQYETIRGVDDPKLQQIAIQILRKLGDDEDL